MINAVRSFLTLSALFALILTPVLGAEDAVAPGSRAEVDGVILAIDSDAVVVRDYSERQFKFMLSPDLEIKEKKANPFRSAIRYRFEDLTLGLNVSVKARSNAHGEWVASEIKFTQDDLKVAEALTTRVVPLEARLDETESALHETRQGLQEYQSQMEGEVEELQSAFRMSREEAAAAQRQADLAYDRAEDGHDRIESLDRYRTLSEVVIHYGFDRFELSEESQRKLDEMVDRVESLEGYLIEVAGFASSDGNPEYNRRLSEKRADRVVRYLTEEHRVPLRRVVLPYGFGERHPVSDNTTREGREMNRRVEVRVLVNEGIHPSAISASANP